MIRPGRFQSLMHHLALIVGGVIMFFPFYYMVIASLKETSTFGDVHLYLFPTEFSLRPYRELFNGMPYLAYLRNSLYVAVLTTAGTAFFCTLSGYAFSKMQFPLRRGLLWFVISVMMIPGAVMLVPSYLLFRELGWLNTYWPLIVPGCAGSFGVFLSKQFIDSVPDDLIDAARIDGCSHFRIYWSLILPLSTSLVATLCILTFLGSWNNFLGPLIILMDERKYTLPLGLSLLQGQFFQLENIQMAGATIFILPVIVIFSFSQKYIVASLSTSGLKG
jgi:multiple sugar transport system permease protein